jgi:putative tryptophan/tyrosine transport system substrate-binding protein
MKRREFITLLGGAAATWPLAARAQQSDRMRRIGVLIGTTERDLDGRNRLTALSKGMQELGWLDGQNLRIDVRWAASDDLTHDYAVEIVGLKPDVIVANGTPASFAFKQQTQTIPIVFAQVIDPVGQGLIQNLARPGGNLTGFTNYEFSIGGKWLQLLKEIAPQLTRAAVLFNPPTAPFAGLFLEPINETARSLSVEVVARPVQAGLPFQSGEANLTRAKVNSRALTLLSRAPPKANGTGARWPRSPVLRTIGHPKSSSPASSSRDHV